MDSTTTVLAYTCKPMKKHQDVNSNNEVESEPPNMLLTPKYALEPVRLGWNNSGWSVGAGMHNLGNTCYMSAALQSVFHVPAFVDWLVSEGVQSAHAAHCGTTGEKRFLFFFYFFPVPHVCWVPHKTHRCT